MANLSLPERVAACDKGHEHREVYRYKALTKTKDYSYAFGDEEKLSFRWWCGECFEMCKVEI